MRWDTRIAIVIGVLCLLSAGWYFRVFRPTRLHPGMAIDFTKPPSESVELSRPLVPELPPPKPIQPTRPLVAPPRPTPVVVQPSAPVKAPEQQPAPQIVELPPEPEPAPPEPRYYTVKSGDSLWRIAKEQLGDPARHMELYELNAATLNNDPDNLRLGQKLILPPK
ncbi:MAG: LysM peptidoglycan-binding domain-containing protein [Actinobacteria bacterium]|nr:LysM peptidoglycan-binding domain-containing protein [Actinomycetota bacterium]